jgi:FkbM family methyltransferase
MRRMPAGRYRLLNLLRLRRDRFVTSMPVDGRNLEFACDLRDTLAREVCFTGKFEPQETSLLHTILRPGMTFVDVGANWGYFTLLASGLVGESGTVVSLEPDPRMFALLQGNVARNRLSQVTPLALAAAAGAGVLTLAGFDEDDGNWGVSTVVDDSAGGPGTFRVAAQALDTILDEYGVSGVDLVKMDIEGAELLALRGMADGLCAHHYRRVLLELHPSILAARVRTPLEVCAPLVDNGYRAWRIDHSPSAMRRAAYTRAPEPGSFLTPMRDLSEALSSWSYLDSWPHLLWLAPGIEEPCSQ